MKGFISIFSIVATLLVQGIQSVGAGPLQYETDKLSQKMESSYPYGESKRSIPKKSLQKMIALYLERYQNIQTTLILENSLQFSDIDFSLFEEALFRMEDLQSDLQKAKAEEVNSLYEDFRQISSNMAQFIESQPRIQKFIQLALAKSSLGNSNLKLSSLELLSDKDGCVSHLEDLSSAQPKEQTGQSLPQVKET